MNFFITKINFHLNAFFQAFLVTIKGWQHSCLFDDIPTESIIMSISDGIGNQLFKYAFGLSIANQLSINCLFDITHFKGDLKYKRNYKLDILGINSNQILNCSKLNLFEYFAFFYYLKFINKLLPYSMRVYIHESDMKQLSIDKTLQINKISSRKCVYFSGYWQNTNYISPASLKIIKSQIFESCKFSQNAKKYYDRVQLSNSVSIHVRQVQFEPSLSKNYYLKACTLMKKLILDAQFYIFSDDWEWVEKNLSFLGSAELIKDNNDIDDFYLLLQSKNMIISNSTFSWWTAYLKPHQDSKIIVPELLSRNLNIPTTWIQIEDHEKF